MFTSITTTTSTTLSPTTANTTVTTISVTTIRTTTPAITITTFIAGNIGVLLFRKRENAP